MSAASVSTDAMLLVDDKSRVTDALKRAIESAVRAARCAP
jgi:hypothetical protein